MIMLTNDQDDQDDNAMVIKMIKMIDLDHDDRNHPDQTEVPMWPGGDSPCFNCGAAVKTSRALYLRELYLDTPYLREHGHHHHYQQLS